MGTSRMAVEDGQTVLIFCPERRSVEPFAAVVVDLHERGALRSLLEADPAVLNPIVWRATMGTRPYPHFGWERPSAPHHDDDD